MSIIDAENWDIIEGQIPNIRQCSQCYDNFDLHTYNGKFYIGGYVGINRIIKANGDYLKDAAGDDVILRVKPKYNVDPWEMLNEVARDEEFYEYIINADKPLYRIYNKPIKANASNKGSRLLLAISFLKECEHICRKLKSQLSYIDQNLSGKVKGKILFNKHLIKNVIRGREDHVFCRYSVFSIDTVENRILKSTLIEIERLLNSTELNLTNFRIAARHCLGFLKNVRSSRLSSSDFASAKVSGVYVYYKNAINYARMFYRNSELGIDDIDDKCSLIVPYVINMELLFELYVRTKIRRLIKSKPEYNGLELERYGKKYNLLVQSSITGKIPYLMKNCIPDIVINKDGKPYKVFDVKYKDYNRISREDSHQLLSYVLLFDVNKCGFIFPSQKTDENGLLIKAKINSLRKLDIQYEEYALEKTETVLEGCLE